MLRATLRQLEYFVAAADAGTVSAAAKQCHASQAAVSSALSEMEHALGLRLFVRQTARGVRLTSSGRRALPVARRILGDAEEMQHLAGAEVGEVAGPLRVACTFALSPRALPALATAFATCHPRVELDLVDGLADVVQHLVRRGEADAGLLYRRQLEPDVQARSIRTVQPYAVVAADHRLADSSSVSLRELAQERLLLVDPQGSLGVIEALLAEADVRPHPGWAFANPETVRAMVARGFGYSVFSGRPASTETFDGGRVAYLPLSDRVAPNDIVIATAPGGHRTARLEALEDLLLTENVQAAFG